MLISVIVPLYYGKKYINDIMEMIFKNKKNLSSQYKLEIIFINDSPEEIITLSDILYHNYIEVKLRKNKENSGIHYSRIEGLKLASGEYVMFFDQDDKIADTYFQSQLKHIKGNDVVVANGVAKYKDYDKLLYRFFFMQWTVKHIWFYAKFDCRIISPGQCLIKKNCIPPLWKEKILQNNGADDFFLWMLLLNNRSKFSINRELIYMHIFTGDNVSIDSSLMNKSVKETMKYLDGVIDNNIKNIVLNRVANCNKKSAIVKFVEKLNRNK